jgi:hypothetical protein
MHSVHSEILLCTEERVTLSSLVDYVVIHRAVLNFDRKGYCCMWFVFGNSECWFSLGHPHPHVTDDENTRSKGVPGFLGIGDGEAEIS